MLKEWIINAQHNDDNSMINLINKFDPLFKKYAWKLYHEDSYTDIVAFFIELIHSINVKKLTNPSDPGIITYINRAVHNYYCHKVKEIVRQKQEIVMADLTSEQMHLLQSKSSTTDSINVFAELELEKYLTQKEYIVIYLIFSEGYSAEDIAKIKNQSRQSINQTKKRALEKIKKNIMS